jgi:hypothetical protein
MILKHVYSVLQNYEGLKIYNFLNMGDWQIVQPQENGIVEVWSISGWKEKIDYALLILHNLAGTYIFDSPT